MNPILPGRLCALGLIAAVLIPRDCCRSDEPVVADVVLRNGILIDGTGADRTTGDVAIRDDRIVAIGKFDVQGTPYTLDCTGLIVAPGFIDLHNHSDGLILRPHTRSNLNSVVQGCTTVVTGNCGAGPIDVGDYYQSLETHGAGTNIAHLLPQGTLRQHVIGLQLSDHAGNAPRQRPSVYPGNHCRAG